METKSKPRDRIPWCKMQTKERPKAWLEWLWSRNILLMREMNVQERLLKKLRQRTHEGITKA